MARCSIGEKKINKLREKTQLPIIYAMCRGGTDHRIDLCLDDGTVTHLYKDGTTEKSEMGWNIERWRSENGSKKRES